MVEENQNINDILEELQNDLSNPELIQDNKLHFRVKDKLYRVRMPNQKELAEAKDKQNRKYFQLLIQKNEDGSSAYLVEKNLIKLLKDTQEVDIEEMNMKISELEKKLIDKYISLAQLKDSDKKAIDKFKEEIQEIRNTRLKIVIDKAGYLAPAIQNQAQDEYIKYLTAICTENYQEIEGKGKWIKVWLDYDNFQKDNSNLVYIAEGRLTELMLNV